MTLANLPAPEHPGQYLQNTFLAPMGLSADETAQALALPLETLTAFLDGRYSVDTELAFRLAHFIGRNPGDWISMQARYDIAQQLAPEYTGAPLESVYWGKFVGLFELDTPYREASLQALAAVGFSENGELTLVLAERSKARQPSVSFHFERCALALTIALVRAPHIELLAGDAEGFAFARKRANDACAKLANEKIYLANFTSAARAQWFDYNDQDRQAGQVAFCHENVPTWAQWHRDNEMFSVLGRPLLQSLRDKLKRC